MSFFARQGRTLLLAAIMVVCAVCVSNGDNPSELVGHWIHCEGDEGGYIPSNMELFSDGTGVVGVFSITWKAENKRLRLLSPMISTVADYKVSGYKLILDYNERKSATYVKKEHLEEYKKKEAEEAKEKERAEAESRIEKLSAYFIDSKNGQKYRSVKIGGKTWMAQNLNYQTGNSWCYGGDNSNCEKYGRLYDWNTAKTACPAGWHLPNRQEWDNLGRGARGERTPDKYGNIDWYNAGKALKSTYDWDKNGDGADEFGFSALPGGWRDTVGAFAYGGGAGFWWSATENGSGAVYNRQIGCCDKNNGVLESYASKNYGLSVRCVADY